MGESAKQDRLFLDGFDPKFTSMFSSKMYISDLELVLDKINYSYPEKIEWEAFKAIVQKAADKFDKKNHKIK